MASVIIHDQNTITITIRNVTASSKQENTYSCLSEDTNQTIDCVSMRWKKQQTCKAIHRIQNKYKYQKINSNESDQM